MIINTILTLLLLIFPTVYELIQDRHGEAAKDKTRDFIISVCLYAAIALLLMLDHIHPLASLSLMLGIRIMFFDYAIQYIMICKGIIVGHWFTYTGKTAKWDRMIAKINPWVRLALRVAIFSGTVFIYLRA